MSREILVVTPENIEIEYELAGFGSRLLANLYDSFMQILAYIAVGLLSLLAFFLISILLSLKGPLGQLFGRSFGRMESWSGGFVTASIYALFGIMLFVVFWGYFIWYEIRWNGQTPGKRRQGLRVIRDGGYPISVSAAITRNLLRIVDGMPPITLALLIGLSAMQEGQRSSYGAMVAVLGVWMLAPFGFMLFSGRYQRVGDFVAGTMVVKQRAPLVPTLEALAPPPRVLPEHLAAYALADIGRHVYEMTVPEYRAVRHYIDRRWQLPPQAQQTAAMQIAVPMMDRLGIVPPPEALQINYADFLEYLAVAFEQYRGVK